MNDVTPRYLLLLLIVVAGVNLQPASHVLTSLYEQIGAGCASDDDCGPNETCKKPSVKGVSCGLGYCECKEGFVPVITAETNSSTGRCTPIQQLQICSGYYNQTESCNDTCTGAVDEQYPENAACIKQPGQDTGRVKCLNDECFLETLDGQCLKFSDKTRNQRCSIDCECGSNLRCVAKCRCPAGLKWTGRACREPRFGDMCEKDSDCKPPDMICDLHSGRCVCAAGRFPAQSGYLNSAMATMATSVVCVPGETMIYARKGDQCTSQDSPPHQRDVWVCGESTFCYACPGEEDNSFEWPNNGFCRKLLGEMKTLEGCLNNSHCGTNEECYRPLVDPPCRYGRCACRRCFGADGRGICSPIRLLKLGGACNGTDVELYPANARCDSNLVSCDIYHRMHVDKCVRSGYDFTWYGAVCRDNRDCNEGLICQTDQDRECDCGVDSQRWDPDLQMCVDRQIGDLCVKNEHCSAIETVGDFRNRPICSRLYKTCTYRLHLNFTINNIDMSKCLRCPEDVAAKSTECREAW